MYYTVTYKDAEDHLYTDEAITKIDEFVAHIVHNKYTLIAVVAVFA